MVSWAENISNMNQPILIMIIKFIRIIKFTRKYFISHLSKINFSPQRHGVHRERN